ncbi:VanW family protein [Desertibacillus haloalkaliphilus]|uniref:VanW family protein n=1 Tax=Desertibacillus haloalkaliphilus TaxID=1328930 RepID=UPI001C253F4D|nr:VanW family protein [Desertibacillus haloalkaliphilus]MBU8907191.1 VanW family protein [Desertibacillus haloalkaliphilus]
MKRRLFVFTVLFLLLGCETEPEEARTSTLHSSFAHQEMMFKKPVVWKITLIDGREEEGVKTITLNDFGYNVNRSELNEHELESLARSLAVQIDQPMVNPTIDEEGELVPGKNEIILKEDELVGALLELPYEQKQIELPIYETEPTVAVEDLDAIKDVSLGSFTTYFNPNVQGRSLNIAESSAAIQHYVLGPDDVFSFNSVVGERTIKRGYHEAKEIVNQEFVMGVGGGICQTSSTLFNAIDKAGLEVVERYTHSREIGYVSPGRDATVSWGGPDFKFKNPYDFPVLIATDVSLTSGEISVDVYASQQKYDLFVKSE